MSADHDLTKSIGRWLVGAAVAVFGLIALIVLAIKGAMS